MDTPTKNLPARQVAITALAVVGFIALIAASMWLAVYATRFVPEVVGRIGSAAVYLSSVFTPGEGPTLSVVPPTPLASTTIPFGTASSSGSTTASSTTPKGTVPKPIATTPGEKTSTTYQISGATSTLHGLPDFVTTIRAVGYLSTTATDSFVASSTVPAGSRPAVHFIIKNVGTNASGSWRFSASIPAQTAFIYQSQFQQSLNPGDGIEYTLGFDQASAGTDKMISITANFDRSVAESNPDNNSASAKITILGS